MDNKFSNHLSHDFEFMLDKVPARETDRISLKILLPGMFFGLLLILIGVYELLNWFNTPSFVFDDISRTIHNSVISPFIFDVSIIVIGFGIVLTLLISYIRYKKIFFDGKNFTITYRPVIGDKKIAIENLDDYEGVRFRIEFYQFGILNKNKYIVELYNKDEEKTIPLYITTNRKKMNFVIERYARFLGKPIIFVKDDGLIYKNVSDISKSLVEMKEEVLGTLNSYDDYTPKMLLPVRKDNKLIIKVRKVMFDAYNILAFLGFVLFAFVLVALSAYGNKDSAFVVFSYIVALSGVLASVYALFRRDKIIVKKDKIVLHHKFLGFSRKYNEMKISDIKAIEVTLNPATGRNFLTISSDTKNIIFAKKVPVKDLRWARNLLIREVLK